MLPSQLFEGPAGPLHRDQVDALKRRSLVPTPDAVREERILDQLVEGLAVVPERIEDRLQVSRQDDVTGGRVRGGQQLPHLFNELLAVGTIDEFKVLIGGIENDVLDAAGLSQPGATQG